MKFESRQTLTIASWNIKGHASARDRRHVERLADGVRALGADIVGLQEVHRLTSRCGAVDQARELAERSAMRMAFGRSLEAWGGEYGNALLTRFPIVTSRVHALPGRVRSEPRSMFEVRVFPPGGDELIVFTAHLDAWGFLRRDTRAQQLHAIAEITRETELPWVLMGDFNAVPSSREIREFLQREHLQLCGAHRERSYRYSLQRLDYVIASRHWETESSRVVRTGPSDHWPLVVELRRK